MDDQTDEVLARVIAAGQRLQQLTEQLAATKAERQTAVLELRAAGWSHQRIADALGLSRGRAQDLAKGRS